MSDQGEPNHEGRQEESRSGNDFVTSNGNAIAIMAGTVMVLAGGILAAVGTPEAALVWTGAILLAIGVVGGDRLRNLEIGREGGKITLDEKAPRLEALIAKAEAGATTVTTSVTPEAQNPFPIPGSYWSQPALDAIATAYSSNTRRGFGHAMGRLEGQIAAGTAVVKIAPGTANPTESG